MQGFFARRGDRLRIRKIRLEDLIGLAKRLDETAAPQRSLVGRDLRNQAWLGEDQIVSRSPNGAFSAL